MDKRLLAWGRAVKRRRRNSLPVLWLFTDFDRQPDPLPAIARLPKGLGGVVLRHDGASDRAQLAKAVARLAKARRLGLVVAGDAPLSAGLQAGVHLRGGIWPKRVKSRHRLITASAHNYAELVRARRAGAEIIFLSPVFATPSHKGLAALGTVRWLNIARRAFPNKIYALGGINGNNILLLNKFCCGAAGITAFKP